MAAAAAAVAAAAARRRIIQDEEESMTCYSEYDLKAHEFKIVRANRAVFRRLSVLEELIDEERAAGWSFLEKFDDFRIRFRRPTNARANDPELIARGINPYRTHYGVPPALHGLFLLFLGLAIALVITAISFVLVSILVC